MKDYSYVFNAHPSFIDDMYSKYAKDPSSVDDGWRLFFEGFEFGNHSDVSNDAPNGSASATQAGITPSSSKEFGVLSIIHGFRDRGHLLSTTNPIRERRDRKPHLNLNDYNLDESDLQKTFAAGAEIGLPNAKLEDIIERCKSIYAGNIGFEYAHIENREKRLWLRDKIENRTLDGSFGLSLETKKRILEKLNGAVVFEKFLHTKYVGQKRFSLEGGESTIAALDAIINKASENKVEEVVIGMAHRGRLNVLANIMGKTYEHIFNEFEGNSIPDQSFGDGDVKYHLGYSSQVQAKGDKKTFLKLAPNPSHLEAVNPVVEGFSRAKADILYDSDYDKILPILIHGDAAVAGQGVVYEVVQMSQLEGYYTGGSIHFIINNQIGFTTDFEDARSSTYCTAAASLVQAPVFHVNGDDPEAVVFACEVATEYRQKFNNDVFIDMVCYRRHGHNEGDDPKFTQPEMYKYINAHVNPREMYVKKLLKRGEVEVKLAEELEKKFWNLLQDRLNLVKEKDLPYKLQKSEEAWEKISFNFNEADFQSSPETGIAETKITKILNHLSKVPDGLKPLSKVNRLMKNTNKLIDKGTLDWALAELLAYGSILLENRNVRMSGQDVKRGTFSHRHMIFRDAENYTHVNRLDDIADKQGKMMIYNSLLSEFAVLGFEYGYSLASPNTLVLWEAQFGDFANGAQTMVDQFITAAESKWQRMSGLVMLLPHGYEGQGPEHSSARLERYLQSTAEANISVVNMTTPANLFHALRRQLSRNTRKPLIVMSPKSMLRHPLAVSKIDAFTTSTKFQEVIDDETAKAKDIDRLLICSGKLYYDLYKAREEHKLNNIAIVRIEQLYPFPEIQINEILKKYKSAEKFWVQEESKNMGSWDFLMRYWRRSDIELISRGSAASPATGFKKIHEEQQAEIINQAMGLK
ncbi:MAG: 2-oxoglutarate dehydrogenase E1 component [Saprospiraceae bacterium]|nr:2-oxoglutarate dehydrogenase E1 component [Saprospiraceae bacterium]